MRMQSRNGLIESRIVDARLLGESHMMHNRPMTPYGARDRRADSAAENTREIGQPCRCRDALRRQARKNDRHEWNEPKHSWNALQQGRYNQMPRIHRTQILRAHEEH